MSLLPADPPPLPGKWPSFSPDDLASGLKALEDALLTDLGAPGFRLNADREAAC